MGSSSPRHTSGLTTRLILDYVERTGNDGAVARVLGATGMTAHEKELRDQNSWFDYQTKIDLFQAASHELGDPEVARHIGEAAVEMNIGAMLKGLLRTFGSPRMLYAGVSRAAARFTWAHRWETLDIGRRHARLRYYDVSGVGFRKEDCDYNRGLLSCAPEVFGLPRAEISHTQCALNGADCCIYEVRWSDRPLSSRLWSKRTLREQIRVLERELEDQRDVATKLQESLQDLVSNLDPSQVLDKVIHNAEEAVGSNEFALLLRDGATFHCERASRLSTSTKLALEQWAATEPELATTLVIDDIATVPALSLVASDTVSPFGSLISAPLTVRGTQLGVLVALAYGAEIFLPEDARLLESYAAQAAAAIANARLVNQLEQLAREDPLTGLLNHREFHEALDAEIGRCRRYERSFALVSFDLDHFKQVNDTLGHAKGDHVLRTVADCIRNAARQTDTAFRVGGDEFMLLLPEANAGTADVVAARVAHDVAERDLGVTVSYGAASWPQDGIGRDALLDAADRAMYAAKAAPTAIMSSENS